MLIEGVHWFGAQTSRLTIFAAPPLSECEKLLQRDNSMRGDIAELQELLAEAPPSGKGGILNRIRALRAERARIRARRQELGCG